MLHLNDLGPSFDIKERYGKASYSASLRFISQFVEKRYKMKQKKRQTVETDTLCLPTRKLSKSGSSKFTDNPD